MADSAAIRTLLAGKGHVPLSQAALRKLVRQGMPSPDCGEYDAIACLEWYVGRLRREAFISALQGRLRSAVDEVTESMVGLSAAEFESLWRSSVEEVFDGLDKAAKES